MNALETHLFEKISAALREIPREEAHDAFALWIFLSLLEQYGMWPEVTSLTWSTNKDMTPERAKNYGSRWSAWASTGEKVIVLLNHINDPQGWQLLEEYYQSLLTDENQRLAWQLGHLAARRPGENDYLLPTEDEQLAPLIEQLQRVYPEVKVTSWFRDHSFDFVQFSLPKEFLPILENVIRELHAQGVVREVCGRDVPIGVAATNDVGYRFGLETTRNGNPAGLSREMEEWMMGESYDIVDAREQLEQEVATWPLEKQVEYWTQAAIDLESCFLSGESTPLIEDLQKRGLLHRAPGVFGNYVRLHEAIARLLPTIAPLMVHEIARRATNEPTNYAPDDKREWSTNDIAVRLFSFLEGAAQNGDRDAVPEEVIDQLQNLLRYLWDDAPKHERIGHSLQYTARVLHALRPQRFPHAKHNGYVLYNWQEFGLTAH